MIDLSTAVTGAVVNGFTTPGYTLTVDEKPALNSRQSVVTALTGTQTGVRTHSPTDMFAVTVAKPQQSAPLPQVPLNGVLGRVARNKTSLVVRKGTLPLAGQPPQTTEIRCDLMVVAGAELNDKANLAAAISLMIGLLTREKDNLLLATVIGTT